MLFEYWILIQLLDTLAPYRKHPSPPPINSPSPPFKAKAEWLGLRLKECSCQRFTGVGLKGYNRGQFLDSRQRSNSYEDSSEGDSIRLASTNTKLAKRLIVEHFPQMSYPETSLEHNLTRHLMFTIVKRSKL